MKPAPPSNALSLALAVAVAAACGLSLTAAARSLSKPPHFAERLAAVQAQSVSLRRTLRQHAEISPYPPDAICTASTAAAQRLRETVTRQADATKMSVAGLQIAPESEASLGETLFAMRVRFQVQGSYEAALGMMQTLAQERPVVFADTVDLSSKTSSVTLSFSGRIYCSA